MKRIGLGVLAMGIATLCVGCKSEAYLNAILARASTLSTSPEYLIGSGDRLTIRVLGQTEFSITDVVRPDGKISFPEHGDIAAGGKTTASLRVELEVSDRLADMAREGIDIAIRTTATLPETMVARRIGQLKLAIIAQEILDNSLILVDRQRTGGIDEDAAEF